MLRPIKITLYIIAIIAIAIGAYLIFKPSHPAATPYKMEDARVKSIIAMVRLCSMTVDTETGIKDTINGKAIFARERLHATIGYDLDRLKIEQHGDTTYITLPPERIDIYESSSPGAYEVLDAWDTKNPIFSRTLTAAEENILKTRWRSRIDSTIRAKGYTAHARRNAVATLASLLRTLPGNYAIIH